MVVSKEDDEIVNKNVQGWKDEVKKKLTDVDNKFKIQELDTYVPEEFEKGERLEYKKPSQEEVKKTAEESLEGYKADNIYSINEKYNNKINSIDQSVFKVEEQSKNDRANIKNAYDAALKDVVNSNIKKGLAHSSIMENQVKDNKLGKENSLKLETEEVNKKIGSLINERNIFEKQKETALENFDISYAVKLADKINSINSEIQKEEERVVDYNNSLLEAERKHELEQEKLRQKYEEDVNKRNTELIELMNDVGIVGISKLKYQEKYEILLEYFKSMPKYKALEELESDSYYQDQLSYFYPTLYAEIAYGSKNVG